MILTTLCMPTNASDSAPENVITYFDGVLYNSGTLSQTSVDVNAFLDSVRTIYAKRDDTQYEIRHFVDCVINGQKPLTDAKSALTGLRIIWKMYEAEKNGMVADLRGLGLDG